MFRSAAAASTQAFAQPRGVVGSTPGGGLPPGVCTAQGSGQQTKGGRGEEDKKKDDDWAAAKSAAEGDGGEGGSGLSECWICRDPLSAEPLVQPCKCRGSMGGVHASCVEEWVRCHRQDAEHEPPHCPVCRVRYGGSERRPGPRALARHLSRSMVTQLTRTAGEAARFVLLGTLLVHYQPFHGPHGSIDASAEIPASATEERAGELEAPVFTAGARVIVALVLVAFMLHKLMVLSVSLPPQRPPPRGRFARRFFTPDMWCTARHVAELLAAVILLGARCLGGELPLAYYLPVVIGAVLPFAQLLLWYPVTACLREILNLLVFLVQAPVMAIFESGKLVWRHRRRLVNPLDGPLHVAVALVAVLLCLVCRTRRPAVVLFAGHSLILAAGLVERLALRRLPWQSGHVWWCALLVAVEAANLALGRWWLTLVLLLVALRSLQRAAARPTPPDLFQGPLWWCTLLVAAEALSLALQEFRGEPVPAPGIVPLVASWLGLFGGLVCAVNWRRCVRHYRGWQRQHATFVLCAPVLGSPQASYAGGGDIEAGGGRAFNVA